MDLKIFSIGQFTEADYNKFCNENLTFSHQILSDGSIYVFYKNRSDIGYRSIDAIETIDKMTKQAQIEIITSNSEIDEANTLLKPLEEKLLTITEVSSQEYKQIKEEIDMKKRRILMAEDTIKDRTIKIDVFKKQVSNIIETNLIN